MKSHDPARWFIGSGLLLVVLGIAHLLAWPWLGGSWEGPVSIRKPILFGISTGITLVSLGWIQTRLKPAFYDAALSMIVGPALVIEVSLIAMQYWRGVPSHFNHTSPFNGGIDLLITGLIFAATLAIIDMTRRCFVHLNAPPDMTVAIRGGMTLLVISCGLGFLILGLGEYQTTLGLSPEIFGKSGILKFPHGTAIHSIQFFPILVWLAVQLKVQPSQRLRMVKFAIAAMALLLIFSLLQTFRGRARFDIDLVSGLILFATLLPCLPIASTLVASAINFPRSPAASGR